MPRRRDAPNFSFLLVGVVKIENDDQDWMCFKINGFEHPRAVVVVVVLVLVSSNSSRSSEFSSVVLLIRKRHSRIHHDDYWIGYPRRIRRDDGLGRWMVPGIGNRNMISTVKHNSSSPPVCARLWQLTVLLLLLLVLLLEFYCSEASIKRSRFSHFN